MSLEGVLNRPGNVRDVINVTERNHKVWDRLTFDEIYSAVGIRSYQASVLIPDLSMRTEAREDAKNRPSRDDLRKNQEIERLMRAQAGFKLVTGNLEGDSLGKKHFENIGTRLMVYDWACNGLNDKSGAENLLSFVFHIRVALPSYDVSPTLEAYLSAFPVNKDYGKEYEENKDDKESYLKSILEDLAFVKFLAPDELEGVDIDILLREGIKLLERKNTLFPSDAVTLAASLKILFAVSAKIGKRGIELVMPQDLVQVPIARLPEMRRFA